MITDAQLLDGLVEDVADARRRADEAHRLAQLARKNREAAFDSLERSERRLQAHLNSRVDAAAAAAESDPAFTSMDGQAA